MVSCFRKTVFPMAFEQKLSVARAAALAAGEVLMKYFGQGVTQRFKGGQTADLVSEADVNAEQAVIRVIRENYPHDAILGEESLTGTDPQSPQLWIIDPLDGTTNFLHDIPHFAVSLAYYEAGVPKIGVVWNPAMQDMFIAVAGQGATHNGQPIHVTPDERLEQTLIGTGFYYDRGSMMEATLGVLADLFRENIHGVRRFGSAALDLCHVAKGYYGAYFEYFLSAWDFAAGRLIVEEAGGRVTTARGTPLPLAKSSILASNSRLHAVVEAITARHHERF